MTGASPAAISRSSWRLSPGLLEPPPSKRRLLVGGELDHADDLYANVPAGDTRARSLQSLAHCGHDEVVGLEVTTIAVGVLIGVIIGRWWSILFALPAGLVAQSMYSFEGFSDTGVAVLFGIAVAIGLALGVLVRKGIGRWVSEGAVFWRRGS
jgi:hypothetical protein